VRILIYPHTMEVGGSQLNAIELAGALLERDHEVTVLGEDGPLVAQVHERSLGYVQLPTDRRRPSPAVTRQLRGLIRDRHLDIVHGYEWPPGLEAAAAVFPASPAAAVCTILSMSVAPFLPASLPLIVGSQAIQRSTEAKRSGPVYLIEPPVDIDLNSPGHPTAEFRATYDLAPGMVDLVIVCRLVRELKLEGILTAIDVVGEISPELPVRLTVVGDGDARETVEEHVARANARAGRRAVLLTGQILDPRPAYATADIVLGMGGSALRALAFGRPLVVQGEQGFWQLLTPQSAPLFLEQGFYGVGDGTGGAERLTEILRSLVADVQARRTLGEYGRRLVVERFSLQKAAETQEQIYTTALAERRLHHAVVSHAADGARSAAGLVGHKLRRRYQSRRGTVARDDFNAVTLAGAAMQKNEPDAGTDAG
jgi:glycosyltransferase involved in cell wall biosynthesis